MLVYRREDKSFDSGGKIVMKIRYVTLGAFLGAVALQSYSAEALTMHECSVKYKAAKEAGTLNGMKWKEFRSAQCGAEAAAAPTSAPPPAAVPFPAPSARPVTVGNAVFPSAVNPKYSKESAGKARMHTCLDQYDANKASNGNGGLKWIQKGDGYYSECNRHLKGQV